MANIKGERLLILDECFRNIGRHYTEEDLISEVETRLLEKHLRPISYGRTTFFKDIKEMEEEKYAPIEKVRGGGLSGRKALYRYSDPDFTIKRLKLSNQETSIVQSALSVLTRFHGEEQFEWLEDIAPILEDKLKTKFIKPSKVFLYDMNREYKGLRNIRPVTKAIIEKRVISIEYKKFGEDVKTLIVHPYVLKKYNNRWFLLGHIDDSEHSITNFALDRITSVHEEKITYTENSDIDWVNDYFYDVIGVSVYQDEKPKKVEFLISEARVGYVDTKPLHHTQSKIKLHSDGWFKTSITVQENPELVSTLLSFGSDLIVLGPNSLRDKMKKSHTDSLSQYE
jgi:predicted DNA-binding transcriptional regulator YafY